MNLRTIAVKNVKHHLRSYLAYFLSCTFTVWLFFQYLSLLLHPVFEEDMIPNEFEILLYLVQGMIVLFAFLFIGYSQSAFLRNRKKDIGLLQVLGMEVRQVTRLIFWENIFIGFGAILLGMLIGLISSKLFFLMVSRILGLTQLIPFHFSLSAVWITVVIFFLLFGGFSLWNRWMIKKVSIAELFRQSVQPKKAQSFSWGWVFLSVLSLAIAYYCMSTAKVTNLFQRMLIIFPCILLGTYLFFTQASVAFVRFVSKSKRLFYRGKNLFVLAQLRFRLKENARILFMVAILSSIVLTSVGVSFTYYFESERLAQEQHPYHMNLVGSPGGITPQKIRQSAKKHQVTIQQEMHLPFVRFEQNNIQGMSQIVHVLSVKDFNRIISDHPKLQSLSLAANEGMIVRSSGIWDGQMNSTSKELRLGNQSIQVKREYQGVVLNESMVSSNMLVVNDSMFQQIKKQFSDQQVTVHAYRFTDWKPSKPMLDDLTKQIEQNTKRKVYPYETLNGTVMTYQLLKDIFAPLMFVSLLIGVLFFLASGSILYFRIFTEQAYDRRQMNVLQKIGISKKDAVSVLTWQIALLFFAPFFVGWIHAAFAAKWLGFLFQSAVWTTFLWVSLGYLIIYGLYFLWTQNQYVGAVLKTSTE